jgi:hypothetical protein
VLDNYTITYNTASFTINPKAASVTPNALSKTYGAADPALTGTLTGFLAGDGVTATYSRTAGETVAGSPYTISATLSPVSVLGNYTITYNTANFTINPKAASVTPNTASKTYGDVDPALTGTLSGFLVADAVTATYSRTAGETVVGSPYTISAVLSPAGVLGNYSITYNTASFTINQRNATWTTNNNSKIFGSADPVPLTTGSGSGFLPADGVTATYSRTAGEAVGTYPITANLSPAGVLSNYNITNAGATFTIGAWTLNGFYQPVGLPNTYHLLIPPMSGITWNSIKGGQTVPLKFNIFANAAEQTNVSAVAGFTVVEVGCLDVGTTVEDVDFVTTGATQLRYDGTPGSGGQFIQNWQTPKTANKCYRTVMTAIDGSVLVSFFKTKK